ncbi:hypothetical protein [Nocardioides sp. Leaf285]|uniref:hypothetical protein n=1 Tax=Nocardioides sp. Leaf285 TaxID=1736322 RepID=UPI000702A8CE|nr:hypothetical protein [Nocardioides sp. Leaf285]KQP62979.1 hypothetical protein ASF47_18375 [Nocardioides sp. Leaf285]
MSETTTTTVAPVPGSPVVAMDPAKVAKYAAIRRAVAANQAVARAAREASRPRTLTIGGFVLTPHLIAQAKAKGITPSQIREALERPYKVTDVTRYPGQERYCGHGINQRPGVAVVVDAQRRQAITVYLDGVVTEIREDQKHDAAALASRRLAHA